MPRDRRHAILIGLMYPSVLGGLIYLIIDTYYGLYGTVTEYPTLKIVLLAALLVHFSLDYIYTLERETNTPYNWVLFLADSAIVISLFLAIQHVVRHAGEAIASPLVWAFLLAAKIAAVVWEAFNVAPGQWDGDTDFALLSDLVFCFVYAAGLFLLANQPGWLLVFVALDASLYYLNGYRVLWARLRAYWH